jgi:hypothetical protein
MIKARPTVGHSTRRGKGGKSTISTATVPS